MQFLTHLNQVQNKVTLCIAMYFAGGTRKRGLGHTAQSHMYMTMVNLSRDGYRDFCTSVADNGNLSHPSSFSFSHLLEK